jgi:hypothetical protein
MSFRRKVAVLGALFVVLLGLLIAGIVVTPRGAAARASAALLFPGLKPEKAQAVEISGPAGRVVLSRDAAWAMEVDGVLRPTAPDRVEGLLKLLAAMPRGTVVTRDARAAEGLGFSPAQVSRIVVSGAGGVRLCDLSVGKPGVAGGSYIRAGEATEVFQTGEGLTTYLSTQRASWLDLRVLPRNVAPDAVMRISVQGTVATPDAAGPVRIEYTLLREKDSSGVMAWTLSAPGAKVDQQAVRSLVGSILGLEGSDILAGKDLAAAGLSAPQAVVTVSLTDNRTFTISLGRRTQAGQYPCTLKDAAAGYLVPEWRVQAVLLPKEKLAGSTR